MEFLKSVFGENSLNYEDFVKACKDAKLNLVDLSKGEYVSKHKFAVNTRERHQRNQQAVEKCTDRWR